jgi:hypothetical protein
MDINRDSEITKKEEMREKEMFSGCGAFLLI